MKTVNRTPPNGEDSNRRKKDTKFSLFLDRFSWLKIFRTNKENADHIDVTTKSGFIQTLLIRIQKVDVTGLASELAFFFLLSLFPLLIFLITLLPFLNIPEYQILGVIREYAPPNVFLTVEKTVMEVLNNKNGGLLSIGIIGTIYSASKGMNALTKALNRSYFMEETRPFFIVRGMSIVFTLLLIVVLVVAFVLPVFGKQIGFVLFENFGFGKHFLDIWNSLRWTFTPIFIFIILFLVYWIVPNAKIHWKSALPGAVFAAIGWIITTIGFTFYVQNFANYSATYGSIGGIIVLMIWLYFSSIILMIGGQFNAVMYERKQKKSERA